MANSKYLYAPGPMAVRVYCVADTALGQMSLTLGNVVDVDRAQIPIKAATVGPLLNEDRLAAATAMGGDQINVNIFNGSAAVMNIRTFVELIPL